MDKNKIAQLREIPLETVMAAFDATPDPKDPTRNWRTPVGRITVTGHQFYNHDRAEGGGGAIDLTSHIGGFKFPEALAFLARAAGREAAVMQYQVEAPKHANRIIDKTPAPKLEIPGPDASKLSRVRAYLTDRRGIDASIVDKTIAAGRLWADSHGNAVFSLQDPSLSGKMVGAELRGTYDKPFHGVRGEQKGMFFTGSSRADKAVFVESAIDALSYEALHPPKSALIVSTTGATKENLQTTAKLLQERGYKLVSGFDLDKDGDRFTSHLSEVGNVGRERPKTGKDWNDQLRAEKKIAHVEAPNKKQSLEHTR